MNISSFFTSLTIILFFSTNVALANEHAQLVRLKKAYPDFITHVQGNSLTWKNGEKENVNDPQFRATSSSPSLSAQLNQPTYPPNSKIQCKKYIPMTDPGRTRNTAFFEKMYGNSKHAVEKNLVTIYWMPTYFAHRYPLRVTRINGVNMKLEKISTELESLVAKHPRYIQYLQNPGGTFYWREIENTARLSAHSYGIAIDINSQHSNYWIWDTGIHSNKLNQHNHIPYKNHIPCAIVSIFEKNGFIWGGKWQHYDTMHFEYRPEMLN